MKGNLHSLVTLALTLVTACLLIDSALVAQTAPPMATPSERATRVCFVDVQTVIDDTAFVQAIKKNLNNELKSKIGQHNHTQRAYAELRDDLTRQKDVLSKDAVEAKYKEAFQLKAKLDEEKFIIEKFIEESKQRDLSPAHDRILNAIHRVARQNGYDIVMRRELLLYGGPAVDISRAVVDLLNSEVDAASSATVSNAPAAGAKPAARPSN